MRTSLAALLICTGVLAGTACWGDDSKAKPTATPEATAEGTATATDCPVEQAICDFGRQVEVLLGKRDFAAIAESAPTLLPGLQQQAEQAIATGTPRLVSVACPDGGGGDTCANTFGLVFTTLQPDEDWTGTGGVLFMRFRQRTNSPMLEMVAQLADRNTRRYALASGRDNGGACNLSGIEPPQTSQTCTGTVYHAYTTNGEPFVPIDVSPANPFMLQAPAGLPRVAVLYIATGCWGCEGYDTGIKRIIVAKDGATTISDVPPPPLLAGEGRTQLDMTADGSLLVAGTCSGTNCGPLGTPTTDIHSRLLASNDGGFTWTEVASLEGYVFFELSDDGRIVIGRTFGDQPPEAPAKWQLPDGTVLTPPANADRYARPVFLDDGSIGWTWYEAGVVLRADGSEVIRVAFNAGETISFLRPWGNGTWLAQWSSGLRQSGAPVHSYTSLYDAAGKELWRREMVDDSGVRINRPLAPGVALGNVQDRAPNQYGQLPALINFDTGAVQPLGDPFGTSIVGRNTFLAQTVGPFAVVATPGDCLNVREQPATGTVITCAKDGVLLRDLSEERTEGGATWLKVLLSGGREGWVSAGFVTRY